MEAVLDQLRTQVVSGAWRVGDRIPGELDLTRQLQVSRPCVREAIRALAQIGMLEVRRGDGTYVRSANDPRPLLHMVERATLREVFEVQLAYDVQAAKLAARRRTEADLERLDLLLAARAAAADADAFGAADARFHLGVIETTRNQVLIEAGRFFMGRLQESLRTVRLDSELPEATQAAHRAVRDAIAAGDEEAAGRAAAAIVAPSLAVLETLVRP